MRAFGLTMALALAACGRGTDPSLGLDLAIRVRGGQLVRGEPPAPSGGPTLTIVDVRAPRVLPGDGRNPMAGRATRGAYALHLRSEHDPAYWVLPVGLEDATNPDEVAWSAMVDFSRDLAPGPLEVFVQAVDEGGVPGEGATVVYQVQPVVPEGELVLTLEWDLQADLDLWVADPAGSVLGAKNINSYTPPPPGTVAPPDAWQAGGMLDHDSNANCVLDGRRRENAVWAKAPRGRYRAFVELAATCGAARTAYRVTARREGEVVATASGQLFESDAQGHPLDTARAPGLFVMEVEVP